MNDYQIELYDNCMRTVEKTEAFSFADQILDGITYRIFLHRFVSYTEFLEPGALEMRGLMFEMAGDRPVRLAAFPFEKFFNYQENPFTEEVNWEETVAIESKMDGSLISTYIHFNGGELVLRLKSKGSIGSTQAIDAMDWLNRPENEKFKNQLYFLSLSRSTVILEWTAPFNRIVLGYEESSLTVLAVRDNETGRYYQKGDFAEDYPEVYSRWVNDRVEFVDDGYETVEDFINEIIDMKDIEGYVVRLKSGQRIKLKTKWYLDRHRGKDQVNTTKGLYELVVNEATDDMRTLFHDDPVVIGRIEKMENYVAEIYNHIVDTVERYHERNKYLSRKEYAIMGQKELDRPMFGLVMMLYSDRPVDYKEFMIKNFPIYQPDERDFETIDINE